MLKNSSLFLLLLFFSCNKEDWKKRISNSYEKYSTSEILIDIDTQYHQTGDKIIVERYKLNARNSKLVTKYTGEKTGNWEKIFFFENDSLKYSKITGTTKLNKEINNNYQEYIYIEKELWFKNSLGFEINKEIIFDNLNLSDSIRRNSNKYTSNKRVLTENDYKFIELDFKHFKD